MSEGGYKIRNQQAVHFITFAVVEWIDVFLPLLVFSLGRFSPKNNTPWLVFSSTNQMH